MKERLDSLCSEIVRHCHTVKIILYGTKFEPDGKSVREVNLCIVVREDPKSAEARLYRSVDSDLAFNLLVYSEEDYVSLVSDSTSYAHSIAEKGTVLYG